MRKYHIGDRVKDVFDENKKGCVKCIIEKSSNKGPRYSYWVLNENNNEYFLKSEGFLKLIKRVSPEDDSARVKNVRAIAESSGYESDLKVGDIVTFRNGIIGEYAISSIIEMGYGEDLHRYELIPIRSNDLSTDELYTCGRLLLEFQYHDARWEKYFITEGTRQHSLPAWRGELYNFYIFYNNFGPNTKLDYNSMKEYNNDTIPPMFMDHILEEHSIFRRIDIVIGSDEKADKIMEDMNIDEDELDKLRNSIKTKINRRNLSDMDLSVKKEWEASSKKFDFTGEELTLALEIDKLDIVTKDGVKIIEDHYPVKMTNLQIMQAIKEAYHNIHYSSGIIMQSVKDRRIIKKVGDNQPTKIDPVEGKRKYRGFSKDGLEVEFWYNFDLNLIESAYPLRMNNNAKKH